MNATDIANTIIQQINYADKWALPAYGATNFKVIQSNDKHLGGVSFNVNGFNHKGTVNILLAFNDTYIINFIDKRSQVIKSVDYVYCDMLVDILDYVEHES